MFGMSGNESGDFEPHGSDFFYVSLSLTLQQIPSKLRLTGVYYQTFNWRPNHYNILKREL